MSKAMTGDLMAQIRTRITAFETEIRRTEIMLDKAAKILEEMRVERAALLMQVMRSQLEEAVEFPSEIYL